MPPVGYKPPQPDDTSYEADAPPTKPGSPLYFWLINFRPNLVPLKLNINFGSKNKA